MANIHQPQFPFRPDLSSRPFGLEHPIAAHAEDPDLLVRWFDPRRETDMLPAQLARPLLETAGTAEEGSACLEVSQKLRDIAQIHFEVLNMCGAAVVDTTFAVSKAGLPDSGLPGVMMEVRRLPKDMVPVESSDRQAVERILAPYAQYLDIAADEGDVALYDPQYPRQSSSIPGSDMQPVTHDVEPRVVPVYDSRRAHLSEEFVVLVLGTESVANEAGTRHHISPNLLEQAYADAHRYSLGMDNKFR